MNPRPHSRSGQKGKGLSGISDHARPLTKLTEKEKMNELQEAFNAATAELAEYITPPESRM